MTISSQSSDDSSVCTRKRLKPAASIAAAMEFRQNPEKNQREWSQSDTDVQDFQLALKSTYEIFQAGLEALREISEFVEAGVQAIHNVSHVKQTEVLEAARTLQTIAQFGPSNEPVLVSSGSTTRSESSDTHRQLRWKRSGRKAYKVGNTK